MALSACGGSTATTGAATLAATTSRVSTSGGATTATAARSTVAAASKAPASTAASGGTTLQWFTAGNGRGDWLLNVAKLKSQEQDQPVRLEPTRMGSWGDVTEKLQAIIAGGAQPPDVAAVEISQFPRWIKPGQKPPFAPLDRPLGDKVKDLFKPSATDPWTWEGSIYGLGNELNASLLSVRSDLFKKAGLDSAKIVTWQDFLDVGQHIKTVASSGIAYWSGGDFTFLAMQAGGGLFDTQDKPILNSPADVKALEFMQQAVVKNQVVILDPGSPKHYQLLIDGTVAAITGPAWKFSGQVRANAKQTDGDWHVQLLPKWDLPGSHVSWSQGGTAVVAPTSGKHVQEAVDLIIYAHTTTKAVLLDYAARNTYPTYRPAYDDPALKEQVAFFGRQVVAPIIKQAAEDMAPFITSPIYPQVNPLASKTAQDVLQGKAQPADALAAAQQQAQGFLAALQ